MIHVSCWKCVNSYRQMNLCIMLYLRLRTGVITHCWNNLWVYGIWIVRLSEILQRCVDGVLQHWSLRSVFLLFMESVVICGCDWMKWNPEAVMQCLLRSVWWAHAHIRVFIPVSIQRQTKRKNTVWCRGFTVIESSRDSPDEYKAHHTRSPANTHSHTESERRHSSWRSVSNTHTHCYMM